MTPHRHDAYDQYLSFNEIINSAFVLVQESEPAPMFVSALGDVDSDLPEASRIVAVTIKFWLTGNRIATIRYAEAMFGEVECEAVQSNLALMHRYEIVGLPMRTTLPDAIWAIHDEYGDGFRSILLSHPRSATAFEPRYSFQFPGRSRFVCVGTETRSVFEDFVQ